MNYQGEGRTLADIDDMMVFPAPINCQGEGQVRIDWPVVQREVRVAP
jgi:hypothetical protein